MKKFQLVLVIMIASASLAHAQQGQIKMVDVEVIIGNRPPAPNEAQLMRVEEANHPNITKAIHDIDMGIRALNDAPDDFGGRKGQAMSDLKQARISLRRALYYRIYKDTH